MELISKVDIDNLEKEMGRYFRNPLILDAGPLVFLLIGLYDPSKKNANDIWQGHTKGELDLLLNIIKNFKSIIITPQILAECTNLLNQKIDKNKYEFLLGQIVEPLKTFGELYVEENIILGYSEFTTFGSTDIGIIECSKQLNSLIITEDPKLKNYCYNNQIPCINFNELRSSTW